MRTSATSTGHGGSSGSSGCRKTCNTVEGKRPRKQSMTRTFCARSLVSLLAAALIAARSVPAYAQAVPSNQPATEDADRTSLLKPFVDTLGDARRLPTRDNLDWLALGVSAALV